MRSPFATLQSLTIPMGAAAGSSRIVIGPNVPAALNGGDLRIDAAVLFYFDASEYFFIGTGQWISTGLRQVVLGTVTTSYGRTIYQQWRPDVLETSFGTTAFDDDHPTIIFNDVLAQVAFNSALEIAAGGGFTIDGLSAPRGYQGAIVVDSGTAATSSGGEVAIGAYDIQPTLTWYDQRIYRLDAQVHVAGTVASTPYRVRVYHGANLLMAFDGETTANTTVRRSQSAVGWCYNNSGATITGVLTASIQRTAGSGSVSLYGDSLTPLSVTCSDATELGNSIGFAARSL